MLVDKRVTQTRSSMLPSLRTPYRTMVSRAMWTYLNIQLQVMRRVLEQYRNPDHRHRTITTTITVASAAANGVAVAI